MGVVLVHQGQRGISGRKLNQGRPELLLLPREPRSVGRGSHGGPDIGQLGLEVGDSPPDRRHILGSHPERGQSASGDKNTTSARRGAGGGLRAGRARLSRQRSSRAMTAQPLRPHDETLPSVASAMSRVRHEVAAMPSRGQLTGLAVRQMPGAGWVLAARAGPPTGRIDPAATLLTLCRDCDRWVGDPRGRSTADTLTPNGRGLAWFNELAAPSKAPRVEPSGRCGGWRFCWTGQGLRGIHLPGASKSKPAQSQPPTKRLCRVVGVSESITFPSRPQAPPTNFVQLPAAT